ncbi:MAG: hypothetical protein HPY57_14620 [Ignavibacteria bacterium]|nr:hypothetical protein [Ignavibacteria bacterium]
MKNKENIDVEYLDMMLYNFEYAIKNNENKVYLGYRYIDDFFINEYWVEQRYWIKTLDMLIDVASELEEYEFAYMFKEIKESLLNNTSCYFE